MSSRLAIALTLTTTFAWLATTPIPKARVPASLFSKAADCVFETESHFDVICLTAKPYSG
jgi:hypothetical protein